MSISDMIEFQPPSPKGIYIYINGLFSVLNGSVACSLKTNESVINKMPSKVHGNHHHVIQHHDKTSQIPRHSDFPQRETKRVSKKNTSTGPQVPENGWETKRVFLERLRFTWRGGGWRCRNLQAFFRGVFLGELTWKTPWKAPLHPLFFPYLVKICETPFRLQKITTTDPLQPLLEQREFLFQPFFVVAWTSKWPIRIQNPAMWRWLLVFIFVFTKRHGAFSLHLPKRCCVLKHPGCLEVGLESHMKTTMNDTKNEKETRN